MYNQFYALEQRPFSTTPNPDCFYLTESIDAAQKSILRSIEDGQGLAVVTSAPGLGKTLLLRKIESLLADRFSTVMLSLSGYSTRSDFLQSLLFEFNQPYSQMGEQELRLKLIEVAQQVMKEKEGTVILVDEAHLLNDRLLDELRALTNYASGADPLFRIVMAGQLKLEERLTSPAMEAINQRLSCQEMLERLSVQESYDYIAHRVGWSGGEIELCFSDRALDLIVQASDGSPRCLSALCDHSLLLSFVSEDKPVTSEIVRQALEDLQKLPLQWTIPQQVATQTPHAPEIDESYEVEHTEEESVQTIEMNFHEEVEIVEETVEKVQSAEVQSNDGESYSFEIGADVVESTDDLPLEEEIIQDETAEVEEEIESETYSLMDDETLQISENVSIAHDFNTPEVGTQEIEVEDIVVEDTYAKLDYLNQFQQKNELETKPAEANPILNDNSSVEVDADSKIEMHDETYDEIENQIGLAIHEIQDETRSVLESRSTEAQPMTTSQTIRYDVVQPVDVQEDEAVQKEDGEKRPYKNLFSEMNKAIDDVLGTN